MVKKSNIEEPLPPAMLIIPREEAVEKINQCIELGTNIKILNINNQEEFDRARSQFYKWTDFNRELLSRIFDNRSIEEEYKRIFSIGSNDERDPLAKRVQAFHEDVAYYLHRLESIRDRLDIIEVSPKLLPPTAYSSQRRTFSKKVFVVHGHDDGMRETVARFIEKLGLTSIILSEQPNAGKTIIEKFEASSEDVGYAVVLLTPDDIGYPKDRPGEAQPRARQNVILELGYFVAKLGRSGVCALHKGDVEIPSDYHGVLYLKMDSNWQIFLAKEIKQVIKDIDLNKAFE